MAGDQSTTATEPATGVPPPRRPERDHLPRDVPRRRRLIHSGDLWVIIAVVVVLVLLITDAIRPLIERIYSPWALALLVVMLIEYLVLKARDRSRFHRMEIQMIRNRRREDLRLLRETCEGLERTIERLRDLRAHLQEKGGSDTDLQNRLAGLDEQIQAIHEDILHR